ncbi:glucosyl-glycerol phosphate synthase [[Leptolyngbya] sp. PCC 7376]|uniref:glucosylglycerol-phosphate synthase n=1 Tax=[Leptolyngbya] sp. PCC 7376 TaxID=111781 RepID=UPI00029EEB77|nr:glucosylglycerol-phosphate synthase [[Leptolyngbya] sp. PCC 7376]AFY37188.1 glucosyl-glycerol phosphate synthase [[Leptolyngbya] sp. PCC 7376]
MTSSLVILYHREPYDEVRENGKTVYRDKKSPNGIMPTLKSFFSGAEQSTWVAWKQISAKQKDSFQSKMVFPGRENSVVHRIPLSADQVKNFYHVTSKEAFWPILHSFPWQFAYESSDWENFKQINEMFAEAACENADDDALFWVHDYNLWLTPYFIRQRKPNAKIAFFHHTPFPSVDIFNILPWREAIVESLLCCDLCGFHLPRYVQNFVAVAKSLCPVEIVEEQPVDANSFTLSGTALAEPTMTTQIRYNNQLTKLDAFPVGTNPAQIRKQVEQDHVQNRIAEIREELGGNKLILSAGRVDYVKGTKEMLLCYERLLERRPELQTKVNLVVAAAKAASGMRVYKNAQSEIERLVGRINGRFAKLNWSPIRLFTGALTYEELLALFAVADIAWITPLRDGLNLVAKEYVIAHGTDNGSLILSEFAGSAVQLPDAILTNPYATKRMDESIDTALDMTLEEQQHRMAAMSKTIQQYDVQQWANHMFREAKVAAMLAQKDKEATKAAARLEEDLALS